MKKRFFCLMAAMCILITAVGCQNKNNERQTGKVESNPTVSQEVDKGIRQIKVSDMFMAEGRRIWFKLYHVGSQPVSYDDSIQDIYVIENGKIMGYGGGYLSDYTLEDIDGMTDAEIISLAKSCSPSSTVSECDISFQYVPDATGNGIKDEILMIEPKTNSENLEGSSHSLEVGGTFKILEPSTVLSKKYFGLLFGSSINYYPLITKYDYDSTTEIILNEAGDKILERFD